MDDKLQKAVEALTNRCAAQTSEFRSDISLMLAAEQLVEACQILHEEFGFEILAELTAVDYWPQQRPRFHVIYGLRCLQDNLFLMLRVPLDGNAPSLPTLTTVYANANWFERELWDMFGIQIEGHPDLRRILMPYEWEGHPLRKDYPLGYEEVQFSFNFDEIDIRKPYAKE